MSFSDSSLEHRSGYVAIVGQPNVGKSTLLNAILDFKVTIVSKKPQTTRNRIIGISSDEFSQIIFVDTPGVHRPIKELNRAMLEIVRKTLSEVDLIVYLTDCQQKKVTEAEQFALELVSNLATPRLLGLNKIDLVEKTTILPIIDQFSRIGVFEEIIPLSAITRDGLLSLRREIVQRLPLGPRYFPADQLSDISERDMAAEIIREKIFVLTEREIPYASAVTVDRFEEVPEKRLSHIFATIHVEKVSQKGILIGSGGQMLRRIGEEARRDMERMLGTKVFLELFVRVEKNWTKEPQALRKLGLLEK